MVSRILAPTETTPPSGVATYTEDRTSIWGARTTRPPETPRNVVGTVLLCVLLPWRYKSLATSTVLLASTTQVDPSAPTIGASTVRNDPSPAATVPASASTLACRLVTSSSHVSDAILTLQTRLTSCMSCMAESTTARCPASAPSTWVSVSRAGGEAVASKKLSASTVCLLMSLKAESTSTPANLIPVDVSNVTTELFAAPEASSTLPVGTRLRPATTGSDDCTAATSVVGVSAAHWRVVFAVHGVMAPAGHVTQRTLFIAHWFGVVVSGFGFNDLQRSHVQQHQARSSGGVWTSKQATEGARCLTVAPLAMDMVGSSTSSAAEIQPYCGGVLDVTSG
eukprot:m.229003 g.229003  ORF g.229003 m.229003 type:complete len:338 (+) comp18835_c0_seq4:300-1313(+)